MEKENRIENLVTNSFEKIKKMIDVDTVVGKAITLENGTIIVPVSKVSVGFLAGGGEYSVNKSLKKQKHEADEDFPFSGGSGTGFSISPIGFLVHQNNQTQFVSINQSNAMEGIGDVLKTIFSKFKEEE